LLVATPVTNHRPSRAAWRDASEVLAGWCGGAPSPSRLDATHAVNDSWMLYKATNPLTLRLTNGNLQSFTEYRQTDTGRSSTSTAARDQRRRTCLVSRTRRFSWQSLDSDAIVPYLQVKAVRRSLANLRDQTRKRIANSVTYAHQSSQESSRQPTRIRNKTCITRQTPCDTFKGTAPECLARACTDRKTTSYIAIDNSIAHI
jgi:hypothetical protein